VLLDFPIDVLFSPVHAKLIAWGSIASPPMFRPGPHEEAIKVAVELLAISKRPVIITGTGAKHPHVSLLNTC
jgi:thiamine pyrophosphate-dependent acetolactate synthase large subunit-like protein